MVSLRPLTQGTPASAPRPRGRSTLDPLSALRTMEGIRFAGEKMRRLLASCVVLALALCPGGVSAAEEQPEEQPPVAGAFSPTGSLNEARAWHSAVLLVDGRVFVVGGEGVHDVVLIVMETLRPSA